MAKQHNKAKNRLLKAVIFILLCVNLFSGYQLYKYYKEEKESAQQFEIITNLVIPGPPTAMSPAEKYAKLKEKNRDMTGWIKIEGTGVDYPVMYTPHNPDYYLKKDFDKKYSNYGVPYIDADCDIENCDNLIIYAHHMKNGTMFSDLEKYADVNFAKEHRTVNFDTLTQYNQYRVICAFRIDVSNTDFAYNEYINFSDRREFDSFMEKAESLCTWGLLEEAEYGDKLLTLSTCEYTFADGRFVVIAKALPQDSY